VELAMRAVIYARYSSDAQREASIADQLRLCRERINAEGWQQVQVFQDRALSGASTLRPGYQALLAGARDGGFDVVVAEALDRLSRDQEDVAGLYKRLRFAGVRIITLAEGEISELHVGLKGTMNALFLKDLADKTRRGLRGRVEAGMSGGGNSYGFKVVRRIGADGAVVTGERETDLTQAEIVRRIFRAYAAGDSPKRIALSLNADVVPGPRGGAWSSSTLNGNRARGTGILNNELYVGRLTWNRLTYIKDPDSGRRRSRARKDSELVSTEVPGLRIVDQELWDAVKARQATLDRQQVPSDEAKPFWSKQRPRYLFSGLMHCGVCGGGFSKVSKDHFGCSTARNKGPTACANLRTIRRDRLESVVLDGLRERLMDPVLFQEFAVAFTVEWNRLQGATSHEHEARQAELQRVCQQIERLVDAITEGTPAAAVHGRLAAAEQRRLALEAEMARAISPAPRLHPNLAEVYRAKVATLADSLSRDDATEARELVRGLVERVTLSPDGTTQRIEIRGELAAILGLAGAANGPGSSGSAAVLSEQVKVVAGTGFEPVTFRL
jgi:site-specific DNA recombinase